jgi:hypothetical protein
MIVTTLKRRPTKIHLFVFVLLAGALLVSPGCQQLTGSSGFSGTPTEHPIPIGRFHDLPVPANYRLVPDRTFIFENPSLKAGILTYKGNLSVTDTVNFFKEHMPANGWRLVSSFEVKDVIMKYEKVGWTCDITVRPGFEREIVIKIGPTSAGPGPSIPRPPSG